FRASQLVQSFKKVAVDQSSEARRSFKVRGYLDEILLSLRPKLKRTRHIIEINGDPAVEMNSYPGAFSQVITNLVMNSMVHGYDGEEDSGRFVIAFQPDGEDLLIDYTDDGKGIAPEHVPRIFDPFFTTKRGQGGSGLGLHLVYNIVSQSLRGTVSCASEPGRGVKFSIRVPLAPADEESH
ncbi:MAG: HAMP domain-containing histidine kinase, partial [Candidatus Hydrogenedentes bacterium]|nr:HAMP domain-containing histidine kinase [Candidatus Hydrogenedentota bacterium]